MNISLMLLAVSSLFVPGIAAGQALTRVAPATDSNAISYSTIKANRAGVNSDQPLEEQSLRLRQDSTSSLHIGDRIRHASIGGFVGTLAGAAIGGGYGAWIDAHPSDDQMISATILLGIYGAISGLAVGLLTGAVWPVN
jgi:hypothetical protein